MANKIAVDLVTMPASQSESTVWGEWAIVFTDELGNRRGIPWTKISQRQFSMENAFGIAVIDGFTHANPALYAGLDDNNEANYCIYKPAP